MKKLHIIIPAIESEKALLMKNLTRLLPVLEDSDISDYTVHIVFQAGSKDTDIMALHRPPRVSVTTESVFSTSRARNLGLSFIDLDPENYVYFLDCDAVPSFAFFSMSKQVMDDDIPIACGSVMWGDFEADHPLIRQPDPMERSRRPVWRIMQHFLWTYLIRGDLIGNVRFNERIGPGRGTLLKSGEDMLFFYEVVKANRLSNVIEFPTCSVFHPRRPADYSRQLAYAKGQGALYRYLLSGLRLPWNAYFGVGIMFVLFIGNSLFRAVTFRHNGFRILKNRLGGIMSRDLQRCYLRTSD